MTEPLRYRQQIRRAVDAFLEGTPASIAQGQQIINHCHAALRIGLFSLPAAEIFLEGVPVHTYQDMAQLR